VPITPRSCRPIDALPRQQDIDATATARVRRPFLGNLHLLTNQAASAL